MESIARIRQFFSQYGVTVGIVVVALLITHNAVVTFYSRAALNERNEFEKQYLLINEHLDRNTTMINLMDLGLRGYFMI